MMKTLNRLCFCTIIASIFLFSCKENREFLPLLQKETNKPKVNNANLDLSITTFSKPRSLQITNPSGSKRAKIQWNKGDKHKIHFALFCKEHPNWTSYGELDGEVVKSKTANPADKIDQLKIKGQISLSNGASISKGTWYIQVLLGPDDLFWDDSNKTLEMKYQLCDVDNTSKVNIPVASKWTEVSIRKNTVYANITCNPVGCLFSCNVKSPLYDSMHIRKITLPNSGISTSGSFQFSVPTVTNTIPNGEPKWTPSNSVGEIILKNCNIKAYDKYEKDRSSKKIYFWGMPGERTKLTARIFSSNDPGDHGMLTKEISMTKALKRGFSYHINFELPKSDLMITEFFHLNPNNPSYGYGNYSMIEIYNPTTEAIDLTKYSLVRQRFIGKRKEAFSVGINNPSMIVSGFQPSDFLNIIQEAVRQDLYIENESDPVRRVDGQSIKEKRHPIYDGYPDERSTWYYLGARITSGEKWYKDSKNRYGLLWESKSPGRYKKMLEPGKCIIVCSSGTLNALKYNKLDNLPDKKVGKYIRHAVENGSCQYIIAVNNGTHEFDVSDFQWSDSGVMAHGLQHVMVLMKGQEPIDVTGPFAYIDGFHKFQDLYTSPNQTETGENRGTGWVYDGNPSRLHYLPDGDPNTTLRLYENYLKFMPNGTLNPNADHFNLVRKPFVRYPSIKWNTNIEYGETKDWSKDSEWIFIEGSRCGGSYLSSWGTRVPKEDWIDKDFLNGDIDQGKPFYIVWPKEYDNEMGSSWNKRGLNDYKGDPQFLPFE